MLDTSLRTECIKTLDYIVTKEKINTEICEKYKYCHEDPIYIWSIPHILDYLLLLEFKVNEELYISINEYLDKKRGKKIRKNFNYIKTIIKACIIYLHLIRVINLNYKEIEFLASASTALSDFYKRILNITIDKEDYKEIIRKDILLIIMFKNRIVNIEQMENKFIDEYKLYLESGESENVSNKGSVFNLEKQLFIKGILEKNAKPFIRNQRTVEDYYLSIRNQNMKDAITWYIENARVSKRSIKKFHPHLIHFAKFIDKNYFNISIDCYNSFIYESYVRKLECDLNSGEIPSRNWASNCISRVNTFMNFLIDSKYIYHPMNRNIFLPNVFSERDKLLLNRRESIPEYIVSKIKENMPLLNKEEQAILSVYLDTGIRLNELPLITIDNIHESAKELISTGEGDFEDGIGWIKVISPKTNFNERIVLISNQTYCLLMFLKNERYRKFGNIAKQYNHRYPELGEHDFLILNTHAAPYGTLDWKVGQILKKLNIKNDDGSEFKLTAHKFRHTFLTDLTRCGVPIYLAMDLMGHVSPQMTQYYDHFEKDNQDIISENKIIQDNIKIKSEWENSIVITSEQINKLHEINTRYLKRGGYCYIDEFQEECVNIDCIECPAKMFKSNYSFLNELRNSMLSYLDQWVKEPHENSDKAIHFLYLSKLYERLIENVEANPQQKEVTLTKEEMYFIAKAVGLE